MSDAKPYTPGDVPDEMTCTDCGEPDCCLMNEQSRIIATVEALEQAEAERDEARADIKNGLRVAWALTQETQTVEDATTDLVRQVREAREQRDRIAAERDAAVAALDHDGRLRQRAEKAEAERDEARARFRTVTDMLSAAQSRETTLSRELTTSRAKVARLREALEAWNYYWTDPRGLEDARGIKTKALTDAALAGTSDKEGP